MLSKEIIINVFKFEFEYFTKLLSFILLSARYLSLTIDHEIRGNYYQSIRINVVNIKSHNMIKKIISLILLACISNASGQSLRQMNNQKTFAKLLGYVRYFYPGDEAAALDWEKFAVYGCSSADRRSANRRYNYIVLENRRLIHRIFQMKGLENLVFSLS